MQCPGRPLPKATEKQRSPISAPQHWRGPQNSPLHPAPGRGQGTDLTVATSPAPWALSGHSQEEPLSWTRLPSSALSSLSFGD